MATRRVEQRGKWIFEQSLVERPQRFFGADGRDRERRIGNRQQTVD
jgi:hypothetical protein